MFKKFKIPTEFIKLLGLLIATDIFFAILHLFNKLDFLTRLMPVFGQDPFAISNELSLGEAYQYVKFFWVILLFLWIIFKQREHSFWAWVLLFVFFLFNDMLSIHENLGFSFANWVGLPPGEVLFNNLRVKDLGELAVSAFFGVFLVSFLVIGYWRAKPVVKIIFQHLFIIFVAMALFGVGFDVLGRLVSSQMMKGLLMLVEDGGEMLVASLFVWYVYTLSETEMADMPGLFKRDQ